MPLNFKFNDKDLCFSSLALAFAKSFGIIINEPNIKFKVDTTFTNVSSIKIVDLSLFLPLVDFGALC